MPVARKFDVTINGKGYMLARSKAGARSWSRTAVTDLPESRQQVDTQYGQLPAEYEMATAWNDWSGGMGTDIRRNEPDTYNWSENMDARFPGQLTHAQKWCRFTSSGTENRLQLLAAASGGAYVEWVQTIPAVEASRYAAGFSDVMLVTGRGAMRVAPHREATDPYIPYGFWGQYGGSGTTIPAGYVAGKPAFWGQSLLIPYYQTWNQQGNISLIAGMSWEPSGVGLNLTYSGYIADQWPFDYNLMKAGGNSLPQVWRNAMNQITQLAVIGNRIWMAEASGVASADNTSPALNGCYLRNAAFSDNSASLWAAAQWSSPYKFGKSLHPWVNDMLPVEDQIYVASPAGLYVGDTSGTFRNVIPDIEQSSNIDNLRNICVYQGQVIAPSNMGLFAVSANGDVATVKEISPPRTSSSPIAGYVRTVHSYGRWLYGGLVSGTFSYLLAGQDTPNGMVWHSLNRKPDTLARIGKMYVDGITQVASDGQTTEVTSPRMWIPTDHYSRRPAEGWSIQDTGTARDPLYVMQIPELDNNPLMPALGFTGNYVGSGTIELPLIDGGAPETNKVWKSVAVAAENMQSGTTWAMVQYLTYATTGWQTLGTINVGPYALLHFTGTDTGAGFSGQITSPWLRLRLLSFTLNSRITPVYRSIVVRHRTRPRISEVIQATIQCSDDMMDREGTPMRAGAEMLSELRALSRPMSGPVTVIDLAGNKVTATVQPPVAESEIWQDGVSFPEVAAQVRLAVFYASGGSVWTSSNE